MFKNNSRSESSPFKLDDCVDEVLHQIDNRGYLIPYTADGRTLIKVGVSFDVAERNIGEWKAISCCNLQEGKIFNGSFAATCSMQKI